MKMQQTIFCFVILAAAGTAQLIFSPPLPIAFRNQEHIQIPQQISVAHRAVVENSLREAQLPAEWTNNFYKNPKIASALAKESWFTSKEMPVIDREAEKIPREQVFKIFKNAGWIRRR